MTARSGRVPALDGMRGMALLGMLAWHAQIDWVKGGFARMTIFFVLAGFLAASSQLRLFDGSESRPFLTFWTRRARRLLPVTFLGVLAALAATAAVGGSVARSQAAGDTVSVLFSFSNWRFILQAREYGEMFETASAFQHYWSLSVEEQWFLALPVVLAGVRLLTSRVTASRRRAASIGALAGVGVTLSATPLVVSMSTDAAYYSSIVRGGEFLAGAAFAVWWNRGDRPTPSRTRSVLQNSGSAPNPEEQNSSERGGSGWNDSVRGGRWVDLIGLSGLVTLLVVMTTMERDAAWLYRGGMGLFAVPAVALLAGIVAKGPLTNLVLGVRPLATLGRWAFPIYVLHWPLFLVMDHHFPTAHRGVLVAAELALSVLIGGIVHHAIERPLMAGAPGRRSHLVDRVLWSRPGRPAAAAVSGVALCVALSLVVPQRAPEIDFAAAEEEHTAQFTPEEVDRVLAHPDTARPGLPVMRDAERRGVALFGGSTALALALGAGQLAALDPGYQAIPGYAPLGCGVLDEGVRGDRSDPPLLETPVPVPPQCRDRDRRWAATAIAHQVDVAIIAASVMDLVEWQLSGDTSWRAVGDPVLDRALESALRTGIDSLHAAGVVHVVLLTPIPPPETMDASARRDRLERQDAYRSIVSTVAADTDVDVIDLGSWIESLSEADHRTLMPDEVHPNVAGAERTWREFLGPELLGLVEAQG